MEENFYELFDNYLDEKEIETKKEMDVFDVENSCSISSSSPFSIEDTISINSFVNNFLNIKSDAKNLYHCGLKDLNCPYVMGVSNDFANKNPELVKQGFLLIVIDAHHNRGTYINPFYLIKVLKKNDIEKEYNVYLKKREKDLKHLKKFYEKYNTLRNQLESNELFYQLLVKQRKIKQLNKVKEYEKIAGEINDQYKR